MNLIILVVEDNPMNLQLVQDILEFRGHQVITAISVMEGWKKLRKKKPDLVLLDIQIPGGGGETLLRKIRADDAYKDMPVIAVTALAMDGDEGRLMKAGFDGYLGKPIDTKTFGAQVETFLNRKET